MTPETRTLGGVPALVQQHADLFACLACGAPLRLVEEPRALRCARCDDSFVCDGGTPMLFFQPSPRGAPADRFVVQAAMLLGGGCGGGFFTMIGRKKV